MVKTKRKQYGGTFLLPIYRPSLLVTLLSWKTKNNADLKVHEGKMPSLISEYIREQENEHFQSMAIARGVVKQSPLGGIFPSFVWHDGWQRDLLVSLAKENYPDFAGKKIPGPGAKKKPLEFELLKAVWKKKDDGQSQLNACRQLSTNRQSPWYGQSAKGLNEKFNRSLLELKEMKHKDSEIDRFELFARRKLNLPENAG